MKSFHQAWCSLLTYKTIFLGRFISWRPFRMCVSQTISMLKSLRNRCGMIRLQRSFRLTVRVCAKNSVGWDISQISSPIERAYITEPLRTYLERHSSFKVTADTYVTFMSLLKASVCIIFDTYNKCLIGCFLCRGRKKYVYHVKCI